MVAGIRVAARRFAHTRRFGVELEVGGEQGVKWVHTALNRYTSRDIQAHAGWRQTYGNSHWHVKRDSTCGVLGKGFDHGWEIATPIGRSEEDLLHFAHVADSLRSDGLTVNDNCGLHVHVELLDWAEEQAGRLMALWLRLEPLIFQAVPARRRGCFYAQPCRPRIDNRVSFADAAEVYEWFRPRKLTYQENPWRRFAVNWVNFEIGLTRAYSRKTVELRLPEGTLVGADVANWPRLMLRLVDRSQGVSGTRTTTADLRESLVLLGLHHDGDFAILDPACFSLKNWLLRRIVRYTDDPALKAEAGLILNSMWSPFLGGDGVVLSEGGYIPLTNLL